MTLQDIVVDIQKYNLCKNWEIEDGLLCLDYYFHKLYFMYEDNILYGFLKINIDNKDIRQNLKRKYQQYNYGIFTYDNDFFIQRKFDKFEVDIIHDQNDLYYEIVDDIKLIKTEKKLYIYYPSFNYKINEEINPKSNYLLQDNL